MRAPSTLTGSLALIVVAAALLGGPVAVAS